MSRMKSKLGESSITPVRIRHLRSLSGDDVDFAGNMDCRSMVLDEFEFGNEESCPSRTSFSPAVPVRA